MVMGAWRWDDTLGLGIITEIDVDEVLSGFIAFRNVFLIVLLSVIGLCVGLSGRRPLVQSRHQPAVQKGRVSSWN